LNGISKQGSEDIPGIFVLYYPRLHCLLGFEKQRASVVNAEMLEAVRIGMHENLFCAIEQTFLIKVLAHQLRQSKSWIFALCWIEKYFPSKINRILDESIVELVAVCLQEVLLVLNSSLVHVFPHIVLHNEVALACVLEIL
jgi:hypothetical protein